MSDNIPLELEVEIMKRLPVRSLIKFRTVLKAWKSVIDSSDFISDYSSQRQHLVVSYNDVDAVEFSLKKYVSIVDDNTFPQQKVSHALPLLVDMFQFHRIMGISHGLLCLYGYDAFGMNMAVLWNLSIRKTVAVVVPNVPDMEEGIYETILGFGVCGETNDPKIIKITYIDNWTEMGSIPDDMPDTIPCQVEVFTLSGMAWRSPHSSILPPESIQYYDCSQLVDGFLYWLTIDWIPFACNLIVSFDMISEEFKQVKLPHSLAQDAFPENLYISKLRNSLVVLERDEVEMTFIVWIMDQDGVQHSFSKLFTISTPDKTELTVLEFRKSGEPVIEFMDRPRRRGELVVYDPYSKQFNSLGIIGAGGSYFVYAYMETLLLLDQPDFSIYNKGKRYSKMRRAIELRLKAY